ncbi:hypothetical protein J0H58_30005 [bacterium]|nr:hypothetical protein [bacterium]
MPRNAPTGLTTPQLGHKRTERHVIPLEHLWPVEHLWPGSGLYLWHADTFGLPVRQSTAAAGLRVRQCLARVKPAVVLGHQDYHWRHEL